VVGTIAAAIEQQATVTKDVAANIAQASAGVVEANQRVAETATVSKTIARDIAGLSAAVAEIRHGGQQVQNSATDLSGLADQLRIMVGRFKVSADAGAPVGAAEAGRPFSPGPQSADLHSEEQGWASSRRRGEGPPLSAFALEPEADRYVGEIESL
jgi:hypothetical protein